MFRLEYVYSLVSWVVYSLGYPDFPASLATQWVGLGMYSLAKPDPSAQHSSVDYNGRSSDICRAIAVYDRSLRYRSDSLAGQRVRTYTHTCTLARLGLGAVSGVVWNGTWSLTTCMRNDRLVLPPQDSAKKAKRQISMLTNYEQEYQTLSWLRCDVNERDKSLVGLLWCAVCRRFEERIRGVKNFSNVWITGSSNHKCSNVLDHARSDSTKPP